MRIAELLNRPSDLVSEISQSLAVSGYISLVIARKELYMDVLQLKLSFELIPDRQIFAKTFYSILFSTFPDAKALFANTDWDRQYSSLMATLAAVIAGVEAGENLTPTLHKLGARHKRYGAAAEHYPVVGSCLIATFHQTLKDQFTSQMQDSWSSAFELISNEMLDGAAKEKEAAEDR